MKDIYTKSQYPATITLVECQGFQSIDGPMWMVASVEVHRKHRRKGVATAMLKEVCQEADREGVTLVLGVQPDGTGPMEVELVAWYAKFGFVQWEDETDDPLALIRKTRKVLQ